MGPVGWGDLPGWIGLAGVVGALIFSGLQACQSASQGKQTEKALKSSTAAAIYQEEREVTQLITPRLWPFFWQDRALPRDNPKLEYRVRAVAGALLDHFEHLRWQSDLGAFPEDRDAWSEYMESLFQSSRVLCSALIDQSSWYPRLFEKYGVDACSS